MGDNAISAQKCDIYEVENYRKGVTRELWILRMNWHKTYRLYSYPAWRDILRRRWDKLSASKPGPASSVHFRRLWDTRNRRRSSTSLRHSKKYRATRPKAGDKLGGVPLHCMYTFFSQDKIYVVQWHIYVVNVPQGHRSTDESRCVKFWSCDQVPIIAVFRSIHMEIISGPVNFRIVKKQLDCSDLTQ